MELGLGRNYWRRRLRRWPHEPGTEEGYTLLVPVPGDLPVFLHLALTACAAQDAKHRRRTIVIPDRPTPIVDQIVADRRHSWNGPLDLALLPQPERTVLPKMRNASRNYGMQFITGVSAARTTHVLIHDADLFPRRAGLLEEQYVQCRDRKLACLGVSPVWDGWFAEHGLGLAATWDLCAETAWIQSFSPYSHFGHDDVLFGQVHNFDVTLLPQAQTDPNRVAVAELEDEFVHFNYVIGAYRQFQHHGPGYLDDRFRMLFISLLVDLFDQPADGVLPPLATMAANLGNGSGEIRHFDPDAGKTPYAEFRHKLNHLFTASWIDSARSEAARESIQVFDRYYSYEETVEAS